MMDNAFSHICSALPIVAKIVFGAGRQIEGSRVYEVQELSCS